LSLLLNADPTEARVRKPEYPEEFLRDNRASFLALARLANMTVIEPLSIEAMATRIADELARVLAHCPEENLRRPWSDQRSLP
jgi:hypothetical protein